MSTQWQKSCVKALVTSPTAFRLFRAEQRNIKLLDQYMNKIWSYRYEKTLTSAIPIIIGAGKSPITLFLLEVKRVLEETKGKFDSARGHVNSIYVNGDDFVSFIESKRFNNLSRIRSTSYEELMGVYISDKRDNYEHYTIKNNTESKSILLTIVDLMKNRISPEKRQEGVYFRSLYLKSDTTLIDKFISENEKQIDEAIKLSIKQQKSIKQHIKKQSIFQGLNVGIEIEYDGCNCQDMESDLLKLKAVSFHSGWDGSQMNGDQIGSRLRENRLRLESHKSLPALYLLLKSMIDKGCTLTQNSGMHYHVDCRYKDKFKKAEKTSSYRDLFKTTTSEDWKCIFNIYEFSKSHSTDDFCGQFKIKSEFETIEWRMGSQTLNYSKITLQILVAIHMTEVFTNNSKPNTSYLKMLSEIYSEI
jgi:hypothetical protein